MSCCLVVIAPIMAAVITAGAPLIASAGDEAPATIRVQVPKDAQIEIEGDKTSQKGADRRFTTPPLEPGKTYRYTLKATWTERGGQIVRTRTITIAAGKVTEIDFLEPDPPTTASGWLEWGERLASGSKWARAIEAYSEALRLDPRLADAHIGRAYARNLVQSDSSQFDLVVADCNEALRLRPGHARAYAVRAWAYCHKDSQYAKALADCNAALQLDARNALAYAYRGHIYWHQKDYDRALADAAEAIRLDPGLAIPHLDRGTIYRDQGQYEKAVNELSESIRLDPSSDTAYNTRAFAQIKLGQHDRGIADATEAIHINPRNSTAFNNRAWAYNSKGLYRQGIQDCNEAIRINPKNAMAYNNRAWAFNELGYPDQCIADATQAIALDPQNVHAYRNRGSAYAKKGDQARSRADYAYAGQLTAHVAASSPLGTGVRAAGQTFTSQEGGFSVWMPGTPRRVPTITAPTDVGNIAVTMFMLDQGEIAYSVDYGDLPAGAILQLNAMINRAVATYRGANLTTKDVNLGDHAGKEAVFDITGKSTSIRLRAYGVGQRQYRLMLAGPREFLSTKAANQFFDSFELTR